MPRQALNTLLPPILALLLCASVSAQEDLPPPAVAARESYTLEELNKLVEELRKAA